ncbi:polyphosphate--glucose phosphotransferase [Demequina sediminicola]|uniref:polyphosphate--glucose phosphotransferase n=1 Tax=Demequina sediminicola TaxID=1095026 RepID=UPI00078386C4|nr:ROK family protein [Demequina sediminicola]
MSSKIALGIDIGGTGIKAAPVKLKNGKFQEDRYRIPTPKPATPDAVATTVARCIQHFDPPVGTPIGVAFPGVIQQGIARTAANLGDEWIGQDVRALVRERSGHDVQIMNDADAAGMGEHRYGAAQGRDGVILMTTLGTGIGSALIADGQLVANTEFGHTMIDGEIAEYWAAESARSRLDLDWDGWIVNLQRFYSEMERLLWPDLIIVGGGVSKSHHMFLPHLNLKAPIIPAELRNGAGIVGAAAWASSASKREEKNAKAANKKAAKKSQ